MGAHVFKLCDKLVLQTLANQVGGDNSRLVIQERSVRRARQMELQILERVALSQGLVLGLKRSFLIKLFFYKKETLVQQAILETADEALEVPVICVEE